ncbi:MAG: arylsulfatase [Planctomycetaceae bacterium]|nr:arylsulfatase [Planctomycetaceae bacterium]
MNMLIRTCVILSTLSMLSFSPKPSTAAEPIRVSVFDVDATPPLGSPLAYTTHKERVAALRLKGIILQGNGQPIVLVAVDWIGIGNGANERFREVIADAVATDISRVSVHVLHQHDAPFVDFGAEEILQAEGLGGKTFNVGWVNDFLRQVGEAAKTAAASTRNVTHVGLGMAPVKEVASNRRILGPDGKVKHVRYTACADPEVRAYPEGLIDPKLRSISFYDGDELLSVVTYYATHPQSYYRLDKAHPDFPGMAREARQQLMDVPHIHFNGAGGNIGAGKYNDGSHANRAVLAAKVEDGMRRAFENTKRFEVSADDLDWNVESVTLPPADHLVEDQLMSEIRNADAPFLQRDTSARKLAFLSRCQAGVSIDIGCLTLGDARILHLPGELFVEYQLAAQRLRPDLFVAMAAYGEYGPCYIGTEAAYPQGGYETSPDSSFVSPKVEGVLMPAIARLLDVDPDSVEPLGEMFHEYTPASKPNIVFIMADDLGYGDLGCYGQTMIQTPHIDELASEGIRFTQCYAGSSVCAPSRCCLMTGLHNGHSRIRDNIPHGTFLRDEDVTLAEIARAAGYRTGAIGKWSLGVHGSEGKPNDQGFDDWFGHLDQDQAHFYYPDYLWRNDRIQLLPKNRAEKKQDYTHDLFTEHALEFIEESAGQPFFLYLAYTIPHFSDYPSQTPESHIVPSDAPYTNRDWPQVEKNYAAMVTRMDRDVGRIMQWLKEAGVSENTLVFFTSDNGPNASTLHDPAFFQSGGPLRGFKRDMYEGGIRVPVIARWPGHVPAGETSDQVWAFWDVLPTLAELVGVTPPVDIDGISMMPALLGQPQEKEHEHLYWDYGHSRQNFQQAARLGNWKGVRRSQGQPLELYDLANDLGETSDVATGHPDVVERIEEIIEESFVPTENYPITSRQTGNN